MLPAAGCNGFSRECARFYMDCGHPEMTTPECANPWDVVRYMHAGERGLAARGGGVEAQRTAQGRRFMVFKTNVDHGGSGTTWGCHTSFFASHQIQDCCRRNHPHLVSRIIYTGGGRRRSRLWWFALHTFTTRRLLGEGISDASTEYARHLPYQGRDAVRQRISPAAPHLRRKSVFRNRFVAEHGRNRAGRGHD